jgi:hypothetical protein
MADREEDSKFIFGISVWPPQLTWSFIVSDAQAQEEEQLENKIINEG